MYMPAAERESPISSARAAEARSPFVRLNDLIANVPPGKPAINLAVGEPQHPVPPFVGPVLQQHLAEFGRYPANKGNENFRRAVAEWLSRRYALAARARSRTRNHRAQRHARRPVPRRHRRRAAMSAAARASPRSSSPIRSMPPMPPAPAPPTANPSICRRPRQNGFLPDLDALVRRSARAHGRVLSRLALESARRRRGRRLSRAARCAGAAFRFPHLCRRMLFGNLFHAEAGRHARTSRGRITPMP